MYNNLDLEKQLKLFREIIKKNKKLWAFIEKANTNFSFEYYIGGGILTQSVWNYVSNFEINTGIKDLDFIFYNPNISEKEEEKLIKEIKNIGKDINLEIDVKNQAKVHLWYEEKFGFPIKPYLSLEDAINTWPTTGNCIGVRKENKKLKVYAPYGLNDIFSKIVRPNKTLRVEKVYNKKCQRWLEIWKDLKIIPWDENIIDNKAHIYDNNEINNSYLVSIQQNKNKKIYLKKYSDTYYQDCINIFHKVYSDTYSYFDEKFLQKQRFNDIFSIYLVPNSDIYLIFSDDNQLIGFASLDGNLIEHFYLMSDFQNKGIGTFVLNELKKQYQNLTTYVFMSNTIALNFFKKHGFKIKTEGISDDEGQADFFLEYRK